MGDGARRVRVAGVEPLITAYEAFKWGTIDPRVEPQRFGTDDLGRVVVDVHQVGRDHAGTIVTDQMVQHVYDLEDGLIRRMEIRK